MFITQLFEQEDSKDLEYGAKGAALGATLGAGLSGKAGLKQMAKSAAKGAIPGAVIGLSIPEVERYYKQGKYGQAGIAAAGGLTGLIPGVAPGVAGGVTAALINACIDDPETCKAAGEEIKQAITSPFSSQSKGRGAGRNVLPSASLPQIPKEKEQSIKTIPKSQVDLNSMSDDDPKSLEESNEKFQASPELFKSIRDVESGNNPAAVSPKGAMGTMQVMPGTARDPGFGVQPAKDFSATELERVGQDYFNAMLNKYGGDKRLALIAYNMGPAAADKWLSKGADPSRLPRETQGYVPKVLTKYQQSATDAPKASAALLSAKKSAATTVPVTDKSVQPQAMFTGADSGRVPYAYTSPSGQKTNRVSSINPNWTPPPGPRITPKPNPQDLERLIRQKNRPQSIDDIINRAKRKELSQDELTNFINKLSMNKNSVDPEIISFLQSLQTDTSVAEEAAVSTTINEAADRLANKIYDILEIRYGDLIRLYGHEVVGDAIQEIVLQSENDLDPDLDKLASAVLKLLRKRLEEQLKETDDTPTDEKKDSDTESTPDTEHHNAVIQIQADLDKIKNSLDIKENKIYFNVVATSKEDLKFKFGLQKDNKGWYLSENASSQMKLDALRTFTML